MLKQKALFRCIRMKRKGPPPDGYFIFLFKLFNTPGNEIAPGSDII